MEKSKKNTVRVILNLPENLDKSFSDLAYKRGITKSNMIIYSMSWFLDYNKSIELMPKLIDLFRNPSEDLK